MRIRRVIAVLALVGAAIGGGAAVANASTPQQPPVVTAHAGSSWT